MSPLRASTHGALPLVSYNASNCVEEWTNRIGEFVQKKRLTKLSSDAGKSGAYRGAVAQASPNASRQVGNQPP